VTVLILDVSVRLNYVPARVLMTKKSLYGSNVGLSGRVRRMCPVSQRRPTSLWPSVPKSQVKFVRSIMKELFEFPFRATSKKPFRADERLVSPSHSILLCHCSGTPGRLLSRG